mmetsp:Transcript_2189/g.2894  ORF Transcript_2189/g.2894 Transcript_2189/m.2894 type:complete len:661 (+) Transcript_2189:205-2187(+)
MMTKVMIMCLMCVVTAELIKQDLVLLDKSSSSKKKYDFDNLWSLDEIEQSEKTKSFNIPVSNMSQVEGKSAKHIESTGGNLDAVLVNEPIEVDIHEKTHISTKDLARIARMPRFFEERTAVEKNDCTPWTDSPFDPSRFVDEIEEPWFDSPQVCKMFISYSNGATYVCSGTLVGPYHLLSARHCSWDGCLGAAVQIRVACGYSYVDEEGVDNFAHYGSAYGTNVVRFGEYDESAYCGADYIDTRIDLDIFLLRLDRALGEQLGWYGMTNRPASSLSQIGYPGNRQLNDYIPFATDKSIYRYLDQVYQEYTNIYTTYGELAWGGESGGPWYRDDGSSRYVGAVLSGGASPCITIGTFVNEVIIEAYLALLGQPSDVSLSPWSSPADYCQLVPYQANVFNLFDDLPIIGVGASEASVSATEVYETSESNFIAVLSLVNSGNFDGSTILEWIVDSEIIATTSIEISSFGAYRAVTSLPITWNGLRGVYVRFSQTNCYTDDGTVQFLGQVNGRTSTPEPTPKPSFRPTSQPTPAPVANPTPKPTPAPVATATPQPTPEATTIVSTSSPTPKPTTNSDTGTSDQTDSSSSSGKNKSNNDNGNLLFLIVLFVVFAIILISTVSFCLCCFFFGMRNSERPSPSLVRMTNSKNSSNPVDIEENKDNVI